MKCQFGWGNLGKIPILGFQIVSLLLYILAADHFSTMLSGAMCATGSLLANGYGLPLLLVKITGVFFCGFWIPDSGGFTRILRRRGAEECMLVVREY